MERLSCAEGFQKRRDKMSGFKMLKIQWGPAEVYGQDKRTKRSTRGTPDLTLVQQLLLLREEQESTQRLLKSES